MSKFSENKGFQAFRFLQVAFVIMLLVAGIDKFFCCLTHWCRYFSPALLNMINGHNLTFMKVMGVVEIGLAIGLIFKPKIFAYVVGVWLLAMIINILLLGHYYDIALKEFTLLLSAVALGRLSEKYGQ